MKSLNMSFEEMSTWVSLAIITFVFTGYFSQVYEGLLSGNLDKAAITGLFAGAVSDDLWAALSKYADRPVSPAMASFVNQPGLPLIKAELIAGM